MLSQSLLCNLLFLYQNIFIFNYRSTLPYFFDNLSFTKARLTQIIFLNHQQKLIVTKAMKKERLPIDHNFKTFSKYYLYFIQILRI